MINKPQILTKLNQMKSVIIVCFFLVGVGCSFNEFNGRDVSFEDNWKLTDSEKKVLKKEFKINKQEGKLYFIELTSLHHISLHLNQALISGRKMDNHKILYHLTDYIENQNVIEIQPELDSFDLENFVPEIKVKMHCLNRLYIPEISLDYNSVDSKKSLQVEVKVKNAFMNEKQGLLFYSIQNGEDMDLITKEIPVFIPGNTENTYTHELNIENVKSDLQKIKVDCLLYSNEINYDSDSEIFIIEKEAFFSAN
jgi:hypothetical protein